jgi:1-acyl-sn-glycerol-3-phosphate acyltransferase
MRYVKAAYFWSMGLAITTLLFLGCALSQAFIVLTGRPRTGNVHHRIATIWGKSVIAVVPGWRVTVEGQENVPERLTNTVIVANHESMADIWAMYYVGLPFRWLAKESVFKIPGIGQAMRWARYVPIRRGQRDSHASAMRESAEHLRRGTPMFFFPEGTRSTDGTVKDFKLGAFKLAKETGASVLPVAIHGAGGLLRKGSMVPSKTAHVRLRILPLVKGPAESDDLDAYAARVRASIVEAHAQLI